MHFKSKAARREARYPLNPLFFYFFTLSKSLLSSALIRPAFVADTLRHTVLEVTVAQPLPHRVARLVPSDPRNLFPESLQSCTSKTATASGLQVTLLPYVRPMALKYPAARQNLQNKFGNFAPVKIQQP